MIIQIIFGGNGDWGTAILNTAAFAWTNWEITLLILFVISFFSKSKRVDNTFHGKRNKTEKISGNLYANQIIRKSKKESVEKKEKDNNVEIKLFFDNLAKRGVQHQGAYQLGAVLDDTNFDMFYSIINKATKSLSILTWRVDEKLLSEILWNIRDREVRVRVLTKNRINKGYLSELKKRASKLKLELNHRNKIHAKLIIKDDTLLAIGSSNITDASMSRTGHFLDCNTITKHAETVNYAINLFESIYSNKDNMSNMDTSNILYSRNREDCLPFALKSYFENEQEEITLLFSCNMVDIRIIEKIIKWNNKTPIKLYVGDSFETSHISLDNLKSMKWLYETSISKYHNVQVIPIHSNVHAKLYLFKKQQISFISSQNLTVESWQSQLEAGILINQSKEFKYLYDTIRSFKKSSLSKIGMEDLESTTTPEGMFSGSVSEGAIHLPWQLPEANNQWRIPRTRGQQYFNLSNKKKKEKNKDYETFGKIGETKKIAKNPLAKELEEEYLSKQAITGRYSGPTSSVLTGKTSKNRRIWELEMEMENLQKRLKIETSESEQKKIREGIQWCQKELNEFE